MKKFLMLALVCMFFFTTGCGNRTADDSLKVMLGSNVVSLDSGRMTDSSSFELLSHCMDGLMQLDEKGSAVPAIAESFELSEDGKTYTFHLREAKWANGDPVTAGDFVFAWRRHCQMAEEYAYVMGSTVACVKNADAVIKGADPAVLGVSAPDERTFVVELDAPVPFFPALMSFPTFFPVNEKFYNSLEKGTYGTIPDTFLSNGAFEIADYMPGTANIRMKKNGNYWDKDSVSMDSMMYQVVSSSDNALTAFRNGSLDVVQIRGNQAEHVRNDAELSRNLHPISTGILYYLSFNQDPKNHHGGALSNPELRLAISNAIDRESLVNNYVMDGSRATYRAVPLDFAPHRASGNFFAENQKLYAGYVGYAPEQARAFLEQAKNSLGRDSFELQLAYASDGGDTIIRVVQVVKAQVEKNLPGVTIQLQPMPKAEYFENITSNHYDIAVTNWIPDYDDPMAFLTQWTSEGCKDCEHWSSAAYDGLIEAGTSGDLAADYEARWKAMEDAEKILMENAVIAPLYTGVDALLISDRVRGAQFHGAGVNRIFKYVTLMK